MNIVETSGLGKRYGSTWALRDCSLAIPTGHVAALVGPNGASPAPERCPARPAAATLSRRR